MQYLEQLGQSFSLIKIPCTGMRWLSAALGIGLIHAAMAAAMTTDTTQFCSVKGMKDNTIYYAEATGREDRSASFADLLTISGIEHAGPIK